MLSKDKRLHRPAKAEQPNKAEEDMYYVCMYVLHNRSRTKINRRVCEMLLKCCNVKKKVILM